VLPDFAIGGAAKAGTTWLYDRLSANPRLFLSPVKEPRYFAVKEGEPPPFVGPGDEGLLGQLVSDRDAYESLYESATDGQLLGEASPDYLYRAPVAGPRMAELVPDVRLVFILRQPADRAFSNWSHHVRDGRETLPFADAVRAEPERRAAGWAWGWSYVDRGFYGRQLQQFYECFPPGQILVTLYDDLRNDPRALLARISAFLGVEAVVPERAEEPRYATLVPRSATTARVRRTLETVAPAVRTLLPPQARQRLRRTADRVTFEKPVVSPEDRDRLTRSYEPDIELVEALTGLDLAHWRA
jgi:hypothetical protein